MKYTINYTCGHTEEKQLFGPHKERKAKIQWLEQQTCLNCLRAEEARKREEQNKAAAEANRLAGYAPLTGTERQVAWAESIRHEALESFSEISNKISDKLPESVKATSNKTREWLKNQTDAKWWIENVGTLKSKEGIATIFAALDGKRPKASGAEIVRALLVMSPHMDEQTANLLGIGTEYREAVETRLKAAARVELEARRPRCPAWVFAGAPAARWNGKIYSGHRIYVGGQEMILTPEQEAELSNYLAAKAAWLKEMTIL